MTTSFLSDDIYMQYALEQAREALQKDEVPIGAIVVDHNGVIIARAYNQVESCFTQSAHAEVLALKQAGQYISNWRLRACWLYVTLEPCSMCMNLARYSRLAGVVYATPSPRFGYGLDSKQGYQLYNEDIQIRSGVCQDESSDLLKEFFRKKRK